MERGQSKNGTFPPHLANSRNGSFYIAIGYFNLLAERRCEAFELGEELGVVLAQQNLRRHENSELSMKHLLCNVFIIFMSISFCT